VWLANKKIGLVLGGGASLALAHFGVLKALEERGLKPSVVAGVRAGAVGAAFYSSGISYSAMCDITKLVSWYKIITPAFMRPGLAKLNKLADIIEQSTNTEQIEDLKIPLRIVTTNLLTGEPHVHNKGRLGLIASASCSIPGLFAPVIIDGEPHVDGGLSGNLPIYALKEDELDVVIAVDPLKYCHLYKNPTTFYRVVLQAFVISLKTSSTIFCNIDRKVIKIEPKVGLVDPFDLNVFDLLEPLGYEEAGRVLDSLD